jgi:hypothetical protein
MFVSAFCLQTLTSKSPDSPMLPHDHPSSFCHLFGMTDMEQNLVLQALSAMKEWGPMKDRRFVEKGFSQFLDLCPELAAIEANKSFPSSLSKGHWAFLIGRSHSGGSRLPSFSDQINESLLPPPIDDSNAHRIALKAFAEKLVQEATAASAGAGEGSVV